MTPLYTTELTNSFNKLWTQDRIKIILNLTTFLISDENAGLNVKSVETIMTDIDKQIQSLF
jgi:predicted metallopeptidase